MEWVKALVSNYLDEEKVDEFIEVFQKEFPKHAMRKKEFNDVNEELKITKQQLDETTKSIEVLKEKANSVEEYEQKLKDWEDQYKTLETTTKEEIGKITKRSNLKELLLKNNAHQDAIDLLVDKYLDNAELGDDGTIKNADTFISKIKEEKKGLFVETSQDSENSNEHTDGKPNTDNQSELRKYFGL